MYLAVEKKQKEVVRLLIENGADVNLKEKTRKTSPLYTAINFRSFEISKMLIEHGADIHTRDYHDETLLHRLAGMARGDYMNIIQLLIDMGADVNARNKYGSFTPLHFAVSNGHVDITRKLIKNGAKVNQANQQGETALLIASKSGKLDLVSLLVKSGANKKHKNKEGMTALDLAVVKGNHAVVAFLKGGTVQEDFVKGDKVYALQTATNLRAKPNTKGRVLMQLPLATACEVIEFKDGWAQVSVNAVPSIKGYLYKSVITKEYEKIIKPAFLKSFAKGISSPDSFASREMHRGNNVCDWEYLEYDVKCMQYTNEALEQWIVSDRENVPIKFRIWLLDMVNSRSKFGKYVSTPAALFNNSPLFQIEPAIYLKAAKDGAPPNGERIFNRPKIKPSFFKSTEDIVLVVENAKKPDDKSDQNNLIISQYNNRAQLIHLMRIYFPDKNPFIYQKIGKKISYQSQQPIWFLSSDKNGKQVDRHQGRIAYGDTLSMLDISPAAEHADLLYFAPQEIIQKLYANKNIEIKRFTRKLRNDDWAIPVHTTEIDLNADQIVDLVISNENCPYEAGDTNDLYFHFNIGGKWTKRLITRSWCYP